MGSLSLLPELIPSEASAQAMNSRSRESGCLPLMADVEWRLDRGPRHDSAPVPSSLLGCSTSSGGSTTIRLGGLAGSVNGSNVENDELWHGRPILAPKTSCSRTGGSTQVLTVGQWEPDESKDSRPVLREPGGEFPPAAHLVIVCTAPKRTRMPSGKRSPTATPDARSSRASATARSSSGRLVARMEIFSEKTRVTPASGGSRAGCPGTGERWGHGHTTAPAARRRVDDPTGDRRGGQARWR